jgi:hypothetical protein
MRTGGIPPPDAQQEFERQLHQIVDQHRSWTSITVWVPLNEGWGEWSRDATGRIADDVSNQDPSRLVNAHSGVNCCDSHGNSGQGDVIDHHQYVGPATGADNRFAFSFAGLRALAPSAPETGRWYHLAGVRDAQAGTLTLYVDGEKAGTAGACLGEGSSGHTLIGRARFNSNPVDYWRGGIDQVHVYDRALAPTEVAELYASNQ